MFQNRLYLTSEDIYLGGWVRREGGVHTGAVSDDGHAERRDCDVASGQRRIGEVTTLLVVVTHVECVELGEIDAQSAAAVVDVRPI